MKRRKNTSKLGRNDRCWCGSGVQDKRCHLNRAAEKPPTFQERKEAFNKAFGKKYCLHPEAGSKCQGSIVKAHTVQKNGFGLVHIARDGKVYGFEFERSGQRDSFAAK